MTKLNSAVIFASQGMTFFLAGEEFCRSKDGDENSYKSDVKINMIDWSAVDDYSDVVQYYKGMIDIRSKFKAFRDPTTNTAQSINYFDTEDGVVAFSVKGIEGDSFKNAVVVLNGNTDKATTVKINGKNLPEKWVMIANDETAGLRNLGEISGSVDAKPSSAVILVDKESYDKSCKSTNGAVVVDYIDGETGEKVMTEIVEGKIGEKYSITPGNEVLKKYKILDKEDATGTFDEENSHATFTVEAYKGTVSSVTIRYVDSQTEKEIAPSKVLTNHSGQQYFTEEIPSVKG